MLNINNTFVRILPLQYKHWFFIVYLHFKIIPLYHILKSQAISMADALKKVRETSTSVQCKLHYYMKNLEICIASVCALEIKICDN